MFRLAQLASKTTRQYVRKYSTIDKSNQGSGLGFAALGVGISAMYFAAIDSSIDRSISPINAKLDAQTTRLGQLDARLDGIDVRISALEKEVNYIKGFSGADKRDEE